MASFGQEKDQLQLTRCAFAMITSARLRSSACKRTIELHRSASPKVHDPNWPGRPVDRPRAYHDLSGCCPASSTPTSPAKPNANEREKSERGEERFSLTCWIRRTSIFCDSIFEKKSSTAWKATDLWPKDDAPISGDNTAPVLECSVIFSDGRRDRGAQWDNRVAAKLTRWDCGSERHFFSLTSLLMLLPSLCLSSLLHMFTSFNILGPFYKKCVYIKFNDRFHPTQHWPCWRCRRCEMSDPWLGWSRKGETPRTWKKEDSFLVMHPDSISGKVGFQMSPDGIPP